LIAEALGLLNGVFFAKPSCYSLVVMEIECKEVVNLWDSRASSHVVIALILKDIVIALILKEIEGLVFFVFHCLLFSMY
jgi:hypothetical protein